MTDSTIETIGIQNTASEPEPSDSLKAFGEAHKAFRRRAGHTQEEYAPLVGYQPSTVASIEQGRRFPQRRFVDRAEEILDAEVAISLYTFENRLVPGLLQTEWYARTLFRERVPVLTDSEIEAQVTARLARQSLFGERPNTSFSFIVEEHVLRRPTGGEEALGEQIEHLLEATEPRNVEFQVMPMSRGYHPGLNGPMQLLETPENEWFAYLEGQESSQFIVTPQTISMLHMRYAKLRSQALTPEDSRSLLERMRGA
jgi:transcriptional regulator with XRE-family HTH domain